MKIKLSILLLCIAGSSLTSCSETFTRGIIHRDCTGTYLELNKKDYLICNPEITDDYQHGKSIKVNYNSEISCTIDSNEMICALYHESHGFVKIIEIKYDTLIMR